MNPMTGDVDDERQLEPKHVLRVEVGEDDEETHSGASVSQLVQHCAKAGRLVVLAGGHTVERVQKCRHRVGYGRPHVVDGHQVKRYQRQYDSRESNQIRNEEEYVFRHLFTRLATDCQ